MKKRKCKICKKRDANTRHAKDYNHKSIRMPGNCALLDNFCHNAVHTLNQKNSLDWDFLMKNKRQEIIDLADGLERKAKERVK